MNEEVKIERNRAEEIVQEFFDYYEIDEDPDRDKNSLTVIKEARRIFVKKVVAGKLEFNMDGDQMTVVQHLRFPLKNGDTKITYGELSGKAKSVLKRAGENDQAGRMQLMMSTLCNYPATVLQNLRSTDYSLMEIIAALFFTV
jgi:hypothetical protein